MPDQVPNLNAVDAQTLIIRGFQSFGDYDTSIDIGALGPCLIIGSTNGDFERSNGSGKSSIINAMLWCLFGRTMHADQPGDRIINKFCDQVSVTIVMKNGTVVTRTRAKGGETELSINGEVYGTTSIQNKYMVKMIGSDWKQFTSSAVITQSHKAWLSLPAPTRRKEFERLFKLDIINDLAQTAKRRIVTMNTSVTTVKDEISKLKSELTANASRLVSLRASAENFSANVDAEVKALNDKADEYDALADSQPVIDVDKIKKKWENYQAAVKVVDQLKQKKAGLDAELRAAKLQIASIENKIKSANTMSGTTCSLCNQEISGDHIANEIAALTASKDESIAVRDGLIDQIQKHSTKITEVDQMLIDKKPQYTQQEAVNIANSIVQYRKFAQRDRLAAENKAKSTNAYHSLIQEAETRASELEESIKLKESELTVRVDDIRHANLIYKSYNDKDKIKSDLVGDLVKSFNSYLLHFTELFDSDIGIAIDRALNIITSCGHSFDFCSGGEHQRVDLAIDLSIFLTNVSLYGKYSNIMVLDEVDSKMDTAGVQALVTAVNDDLSQRFDSIMVVSHMYRMRDSFPSRIIVDKRDGFSYATVEQ